MKKTGGGGGVGGGEARGREEIRDDSCHGNSLRPLSQGILIRTDREEGKYMEGEKKR